MENKKTKQVSTAVAPKGLLVNKENKERQSDAARRFELYKKQAGAPSRPISVSSEDNVSSAASAKNGALMTIDINAWETKARKAMQEYCHANGIDTVNNLLGEVQKKAKSDSSKGVSLQTVVDKLQPIFKGLDILMSEQRFSPVRVLELLEPLSSDYFVKTSARYWHLRAKAAIGANDYDRAVDFLDLAAKHGAQPIMEMQRAYHTVCHKLLEKVNALEEPRENVVNGAGVQQANAIAEVGENGENNADDETGAKDNSETEGTGADIEEDQQNIIDNQDDAQPPPAVIELQDQPPVDQQPNPPQEIQVDEAPKINETFDVNPPPRGSMGVPEDVPNANGAVNGEHINDAPAVAAAAGPLASPGTRRRMGDLDQGAVFESSKRKLLVAQNKSTKKQNGAAAADVYQFTATPVRRSTRPGAEFDKWHKYRTTTVDSPADLGKLGIGKDKLSYKANPYLSDGEESD